MIDPSNLCMKGLANIEFTAGMALQLFAFIPFFLCGSDKKWLSKNHSTLPILELQISRLCSHTTHALPRSPAKHQLDS